MGAVSATGKPLAISTIPSSRKVTPIVVPHYGTGTLQWTLT